MKRYKVGFNIMGIGLAGYIFFYAYGRLGDIETIETARLISDLGFLSLMMAIVGLFVAVSSLKDIVSEDEPEREQHINLEERDYNEETFIEKHPILIFTIIFIIILAVSIIALS